jgi:hypothetical protein
VAVGAIELPKTWIKQVLTELLTYGPPPRDVPAIFERYLDQLHEAVYAMALDPLMRGPILRYAECAFKVPNLRRGDELEFLFNLPIKDETFYEQVIAIARPSELEVHNLLMHNLEEVHERVSERLFKWAVAVFVTGFPPGKIGSQDASSVLKAIARRAPELRQPANTLSTISSFLSCPSLKNHRLAEVSRALRDIAKADRVGYAEQIVRVLGPHLRTSDEICDVVRSVGRCVGLEPEVFALLFSTSEAAGAPSISLPRTVERDWSPSRGSLMQNYLTAAARLSWRDDDQYFRPLIIGATDEALASIDPHHVLLNERQTTTVQRLVRERRTRLRQRAAQKLSGGLHGLGRKFSFLKPRLDKPHDGEER